MSMNMFVFLQVEHENSLSDRATWLDTRGVESEFKLLTYKALQLVRGAYYLFCYIIGEWIVY